MDDFEQGFEHSNAARDIPKRHLVEELLFQEEAAKKSILNVRSHQRGLVWFSAHQLRKRKKCMA